MNGITVLKPENLNLEILAEEEPELKPCSICGRTFNLQSLARHEKVCENTRKYRQRNVFNSFLQRSKTMGVVSVTNEKKEEKCRSKCKNREHGNPSSFNKCNHTFVLNNGLFPQKSTPTGYVQCPACHRCFSKKAADRHIAWCQDQQTRLPKTLPNAEALERLKARVKYQAPLPLQRSKSKCEVERAVKSADFFHRPLNASKSPLLRKRRSCPESPSIQDVPSVSTNPKDKKAVKFKEVFPEYKSERKSNIDVLAALRLQLSQLETSDFYNKNCSSMLEAPDDNFQFAVQKEMVKDMWSSDGEIRCSTSSSSEGSLPSRANSSERRIPRFCYNCGTKYPLASAKYCCECGTRRLQLIN